MTETQTIILPKAIYLDANVLIALPYHLGSPVMIEMLETADRLNLGLFVPELAAEEWLAHTFTDAMKTLKQLRTGTREIGNWLDRDALGLETVDDHKFREMIRKVQLQRLADLNIHIVGTPDIELRVLIDYFLEKRPPFAQGDKGFKDAVILETVLHHACDENSLDCIVLGTSDKAFQDSSIANRFADRGTELHVATGRPEEVVPRIREMLTKFIDKATSEAIVRRCERALNFVRTHQEQVFDFVMANATLSMSLLKGHRVLALGQERDINDKKLDYSRIESIDAVRPKEIGYAFPGLAKPGCDDRPQLLMSVDIEIDVTIRWPNPFVEPAVPLTEASRLLEPSFDRELGQRTEHLTVLRSLTVKASVSPDGANRSQFQDMRLEEVY